jgi:signal transduction histidine kinase/ActR/RegA family two-component response regulator
MSTELAHEETARFRLMQLVRTEQVRIHVEQVKRIPLPHFAMDSCVAWIAWRNGIGPIVFVWLIAITAGQLWRTVDAVRIFHQRRLSIERIQLRLSVWLCLLGALQIPMVVLVFSRPLTNAHYILTMIMVGNAAGAVSPCAGHVPSYAYWAFVYGGALAVAWLSQHTFEGAAISLLLVFLFLVLTLYVRDEGRTLRKLVELTESLRLERDRADSERQRAEAASEAKTRFFAAANHDLRQPLHALAINAATIHALAQRSGDEVLGRVSDGVRRALAESRGLLDSLLDISRLDAGAIRVEWSDQDVIPLVSQIRETFLALAEERGIALELDITDAAAPLIARTDPELLRRILHNLVGNAIKFTSEGEVTIHVGRRQAGIARQLFVAVRDTGPGIPADEQERVFEEFYQLGNPERDRSRGLGLGLAIVRRTAQLIAADIALESTPGIGSSFVVTLPAAARTLMPGATETTLSLPDVPDGRTRRVLLIDDEPEVRDSLSILLHTLGWEVCAAAGIAEAESIFVRGFEPDALLVDFRLRGGASGLDAIRHLRERECLAPAILVTGDTEPARVAAAREAGLPVLYKPVDGMQLATALHRVIETHHIAL